MVSKKKLKREKKGKSAQVIENTINSGEKVLEAVAEEEVFVQAEVEEVVEAVAEVNVIAEIEKEEIVFLESALDEDLANEEMVQFDEEKTEEAIKIAEAAKKVAEAAHKLAMEDDETNTPEVADENKEAISNDTTLTDTTKSNDEPKSKPVGQEVKPDEIKSADAKTENNETAGIEKIISDAEVSDDKMSKADKKEVGTIMSGLMKEVEPQDEKDADDANADLDDMDIPKPPKLAKLPIFIDYCVSQNLKFKTYVKVAKVLLSTLKTYKDSPENKSIAMDCIKKLVPALVRAKADEKK